jgi:hypothetical protein
MHYWYLRRYDKLAILWMQPTQSTNISTLVWEIVILVSFSNFHKEKYLKSRIVTCSDAINKQRVKITCTTNCFFYLHFLNKFCQLALTHGEKYDLGLCSCFRIVRNITISTTCDNCFIELIFWISCLKRCYLPL